MDWQAIAAEMPRDIDYPARAWALDAMTRVLEGRLYDHIMYPFADEKLENGQYVPLRKRRPSVRSDLCRVVVDDSVSLLFDEGHFPEIAAEKPETVDALKAIAKTIRLNAMMIEAATRGSVGSVALYLQIIDRKPRVLVMPTTYLTPTLDPADGVTVTGCVETFKVAAAALKAQGFTVPADETTLWWRREWTATHEVLFVPQTLANKAEGKEPMALGAAEPGKLGTRRHDLGFVPIVWIRNLPGGDDVDGVPTMPPAAISTMIEIDYQLSQAGRGLKYASDPMMMIRDPNGEDGRTLVGGATSALMVGEKGDAKLLEISGDAAGAVVAYVTKLREVALEAMHGNRSNADKLSAAQSGRALELLHQPLIWLTDRLRISYGEIGMLGLLRMICMASAKYPIATPDAEFRDIDPKGLALKWSSWFAPTAEDKQTQAGTLVALTNASLLSHEAARADLAPVFDIEDPEAEAAAIEADRAAETALLADRAAQVQAKQNTPD